MNYCNQCRYWSEMLAMCDGGLPLSAMCLSITSAKKGKYTYEHSMACPAFAGGREEVGAIDSPEYDIECARAQDAED